MLNNLPKPVKAFGAVAAVLAGASVAGCTTTGGTTYLTTEESYALLGGTLLFGYILGQGSNGDVNINYSQDQSLTRNTPVAALVSDRRGQQRYIKTSAGEAFDEGCRQTNDTYRARDGYDYRVFDCRHLRLGASF